MKLMNSTQRCTEIISLERTLLTTWLPYKTKMKRLSKGSSQDMLRKEFLQIPSKRCTKTAMLQLEMILHPKRNQRKHSKAKDTRERSCPEHKDKPVLLKRRLHS